MDTLAAKIKLDPATGQIRIAGFDLDKVIMKRGDLPEKPRLPILDRSMLQRAEVKKKPRPNEDIAQC